jgi:N-sulfoglucosamine sulfohydrolase
MIRLILALIIVSFYSCSNREESLPPPNILWITSEDNSPFLGCYGDSLATTPNLDRLAKSGFLYTHAYANAPVCAPARNTIITGVYANSGGHEHMRSFYMKSDEVKLYPELLRQAGYFCTNNAKEDFNIHPDQTKNLWNELGKDAHYKNRKPGQPFFAIFNSNISHESSIHKSIPTEELRHKPADMVLPPYHPDTEEMRHDWAQYYDKIEAMDKWVGKILKELEESGEAENTIIFYYGDHGGVLGRSKRFVYESGTRIPFIVHIPEKYKHLYPAENPGDKVDRIISSVDLPPTLLSMIDTTIPSYLQGSAFLGKQKTEDPRYAFMFRGRMDERYDMCRAVRDHKFRYIRNYMPHREYAQFIDYLWRAPSMQSWEAAWKAGKCNDIQSIFWNQKPVEELYDTENDPWEVNNLAANPEYRDVLERMRKANRDWMLRIKDAGFIPEAQRNDRTKDMAAYDYMRNGEVDLEELIDVAEQATRPASVDVSKLIAFMKSGDPTIRYWGATGLLILEGKARPALDELKVAAKDPSMDVAIVAGEALYRLGEKQEGKRALLAGLKASDAFARAHALNAIDAVQENSREIQNGVIDMVKNLKEFDNQTYDWRSAKGLLTKWKVDLQKNGIEL